MQLYFRKYEKGQFHTNTLEKNTNIKHKTHEW